MTPHMPFMLEDHLVKNGGIFEKAGENWGAKVCVDGRLVTGQNPASATPLGKAIHKLLSN